MLHNQDLMVGSKLLVHVCGDIQMIQLTCFALDSGRSLCRGSLGRLATGCSISMDQGAQLLRGLAAQLCQNLSHYVWRGSSDRQKL